MEARSSQCPRIRRRIGKTRSSSQRKVSERPRRDIYGVSACFPGYGEGCCVSLLTLVLGEGSRCGGIDQGEGQMLQGCVEISVDLQHQAET